MTHHDPSCEPRLKSVSWKEKVLSSCVTKHIPQPWSKRVKLIIWHKDELNHHMMSEDWKGYQLHSHLCEHKLLLVLHLQLSVWVNYRTWNQQIITKETKKTPKYLFLWHRLPYLSSLFSVWVLQNWYTWVINMLCQRNIKFHSLNKLLVFSVRNKHRLEIYVAAHVEL